MRGVRSLSPQVLEEEQPRRAPEAAQAQVHRLLEDLQPPALPDLPRREEPSAADVRVQRVQVQEQQQGHPEESLHSAAHEQLRLRVRHVRQAVQDKEGPEPPREAESQRGTADRVRRLRPLQQEPPRPQGSHEVQALQTGIRLPDMSTGHDDPRELGAASHVARNQGEGTLSDLRQEIPGTRPGLAHESAHRGETVPLPRLRKDFSAANCSRAARVDPYRKKTLYLRYLRSSVRPKARLDLPQKETSWPATSVARSFH